MSTKKTIFVCEFITAGGFSGEALPASLIAEGTLMRDQLCKELLQLRDYQLISLHDARLPPAKQITSSYAVSSAHEFEAQFAHALSQATMAWIIAPEFDDILTKLSQQSLDAGVVSLGLSSDTIQQSTDKLNMGRWFSQHGINSPATFTIEGWQQSQQRQDNASFAEDQWLAKPIKGVGCEGINFFNHAQMVDRWIEQIPNTQIADYFLQPYLPGEAASLSMICHASTATLLSCNKLLVERQEDQFALKGVEINGMRQYWSDFNQLAQQIAAGLPDETGYLGVDVIVQDGKIQVLELNPRLTTSYVGLAQATDQNIAALIIAAKTNQRHQFSQLNLKRDIVTINL